MRFTYLAGWRGEVLTLELEAVVADCPLVAGEVLGPVASPVRRDRWQDDKLGGVRLRVMELAAACGGIVYGAGDEAWVDGAANDSRELSPDQLFVAIVAERDGHEFVAAAEAAGAAAYLGTRPVEGSGLPGVLVDDVMGALADLGRLARSRLPGRVVGVTGSVGKTSTKDLTAAVLATSFATHANRRSFNNEIGVPLTLLGAPDGTEAAVIEMGARGRGHIAELAAIAHPTAAIVTAVAAAHTELFGDLDDVAAAKGELVEAVPADGVAVLNADDDRVLAMRGRTIAHVVTYGATGDVRAEGLALDDELRPRFTLVSPWGSAAVAMEARGAHMAHNALGAAAAGLALGVSPEAAAHGLRHAELSPWRMEVTRRADGLIVINDAYNANPASMRAALDSLAAVPAVRRVAVLGVMAELGDGAPQAHREVAARARELDIEVIAVGTDLYGMEPMADATTTAVSDAVTRGLGAGDAVLVKGSRVAGLDRLATALTRGSG